MTVSTHVLLGHYVVTQFQDGVVPVAEGEYRVTFGKAPVDGQVKLSAEVANRLWGRLRYDEDSGLLRTVGALASTRRMGSSYAMRVEDALSNGLREGLTVLRSGGKVTLQRADGSILCIMERHDVVLLHDGQ